MYKSIKNSVKFFFFRYVCFHAFPYLRSHCYANKKGNIFYRRLMHNKPTIPLPLLPQQLRLLVLNQVITRCMLVLYCLPSIKFQPLHGRRRLFLVIFALQYIYIPRGAKNVMPTRIFIQTHAETHVRLSTGLSR